MDNTSHQKLFLLLLLLHFIPLLLFIEGCHSRGGLVREEASAAAVPHSDLVKHALLLVLLIFLSRRLGGGVAGVEPAAPGPSPPLGLVVDADLAALLLRRCRLLLVTIQPLLLLLLLEGTHAVVG